MRKHEKKCRARVTHILVFSGMVMCLLGVLLPEGHGHAQRRVKPEVVLPRDYPNGFHGYGRLDLINDKAVAIDDVNMKLAPYVTFHTPREKTASMHSIKPGDLVGYLKDSDNQIVSLWLIE